MDQATPLWTGWQSLLSTLASGFTRPGWVRVVPWVTGMVWCWEEPTSTPILTVLGLESRWRVLEHVAESGAWDREAVERQTLRLIAQERPARWGSSPPVAVDETQWHRTSKPVWGTCPCHESSARSPHRAATVRAHHGVVMGDRGTGPALDGPAPCRPAVWPPKPVAPRRNGPHQDGPGGGAVVASRRGVDSTHAGGV